MRVLTVLEIALIVLMAIVITGRLGNNTKGVLLFVMPVMTVIVWARQLMVQQLPPLVVWLAMKSVGTVVMVLVGITPADSMGVRQDKNVMILENALELLYLVLVNQILSGELDLLDVMLLTNVAMEGNVELAMDICMMMAAVGAPDKVGKPAGTRQEQENHVLHVAQYMEVA